MSHDADRFMTTPEAAAYLELSPRTLNTYRVTGAGPAFYRFGPLARYRRSDLDAWLSKRRSPGGRPRGGNPGDVGSAGRVR